MDESGDIHYHENGIAITLVDVQFDNLEGAI